MIDIVTYGVLGIVIGGMLFLAHQRPQWIKYILAGIGLLVGMGAAYAVSQRQRRFRELGASSQTAHNIALLLAQGEAIQRSANVVIGEATKETQLREVQKRIEAELKTIPVQGGNVEAIREEVRRIWEM